MIRHKVLLLVFLFLISTIRGENRDDCRIGVMFYKMENGNYTDLGASGTGSCKSDQGMFYKKAKGSGIKGGIINEVENPLFEVIYSLRVHEVRGEQILYGVVYWMNFNESQTISNGNKIILDQPIQAGIEEKIEIGEYPDGSTLYIGITMMDEQPIRDESPAPITVKTSDGAEVVVVNNKNVLEEKNQFQTGFGKWDDGKAVQLKYIMDITIADMPDSLIEPFTTTLTFKRRYWVDTDYYSDKQFKKDVEFTSEFKLDIKLVPGDKIILVFPPDTPSVRGFDITDTLFLRP